MFYNSFICIFVLINVALVSGQRPQGRSFSQCSMWGDPHLSPFNMNTSLLRSSSRHCQLPETPVVLFANRFARVDVKNLRSLDVIIDFNITFFDEGEIVCRIGANEFSSGSSRRECGSPSIVLVNNRTSGYPRISIVHRNAYLSIFVTEKFWSGSKHYTFVLYTTPLEAASSTGMCRELCPPVVNARSVTNLYSRSSNYVVSLLASEVCRIYIDELNKVQDIARENLTSVIEDARRSCVIDVSITGNTRFGEDTIDNILVEWIASKITDLLEIQPLFEQGQLKARQIVNAAMPHILQMVSHSTWPGCTPESPYCIAPDEIFWRRK